MAELPADGYGRDGRENLPLTFVKNPVKYLLSLSH
jgi:hypothetical protein